MYEKILISSVHLFSRYGIKRVSMQFISNEIGISKKTLYEVFDSKDELVSSAVEWLFGDLWEDIRKQKGSSVSAVKSIVQIYLSVFRRSMNVCPAFYEDLRSFGDASKHFTKGREQLVELYAEYLAKGVEQEMFVPDQNYKTLALLYSELPGNSTPEFQLTLLFTTLRGVCTEKGCKELIICRPFVNNIIHAF